MRWKFVLLLLCSITLVFASTSDDDYDDEEPIEQEDNYKEDDPDLDEDIQNYESPVAHPNKFHFADHFDDYNKFLQNWIKSEAKKDDTAEEIAKYDGEWQVEAPVKQVLKNDLGLVLKSKAKHAAIASKLAKPFVFDNKPLVVQYEVTMQDGQECGGSYIKLLSSGKETSDLTKFNDKTPYTIMFGPDKCGNDVKLHFIFRHRNPINGSITEKHCRKPKERLEEPFRDKLPHLYQLVVRPDNTFQIKVDQKVVNEGSLLSDFTPPVNPEREIDDPNDIKPADWDEREKIPDPDSKKPDDWDENALPHIPDPNAVKPEGWLDDEEEMIPDPNAKKPEDWDTEMDGEWEAPLIENPVCEKAVGCGVWKAPLIPNPDYKGKWRAPLIDNPNYQGKWAPRKIPNPDFFEDFNPFEMTSISAVGIELWSMSSNILFDNLVITDEEEMALDWAAKTFDLKRKQIEKESENFFSKVVKLTNDNPWLWGVYILVVGVPLAFIIYTSCFSKDKKSVNAKKTDEPTADDEPSNAEEKSDTHHTGGGDATKNQKPSPKSKKSDLEVNDNEEKESLEGEDADVIEDLSENTEEAAPQITENSPEGARKRKPRKE